MPIVVFWRMKKSRPILTSPGITSPGKWAKPSSSSYALLCKCLCTTGFVMHGLHDEFADLFSSVCKSLFFGFFIPVYEN
jgi:hypothetical protein